MYELKACKLTSDEDFKGVKIDDCGKLLKTIIKKGAVACASFRSILKNSCGILLHPIREYDNLNFSVVQYYNSNN